MAVNEQFSGNVVDSSEQPLPNIRYRGYHTNTNTWSDWYYSNNNTQYNINLGDATWLSQTGNVSIGDVVLLVFETLETDIKVRQFSMVKLILNANKYYVNDVQLLSSHPPVIVNRWSLSSITDGNNKYTIPNTNEEVHLGRVNETVTALVNPNTRYTWYYNGLLHYQIETYYSQDIFKDRIAVSKIEYMWDTSYIDIDRHIYTRPSVRTLGYDTVRIKVTNASNDIVEDDLKIQIRYRKPIPLLTWTPREPDVTDILVIRNKTTDVDNRVINMDYYFDDVIEISNDDINYTWRKSLDGLYANEYIIRMDLLWDNGFFQVLDSVFYRLSMTKIPPTFDVIVESIDKTTYRFTPTNIVDPDGPISDVNFRWTIEYFMEFDSEYKTIYNSEYSSTIDQSPKEWVFNTPGLYRITTHGLDSGGSTHIVTSEVTIVESDCISTTGVVTLDFNTDKFIAIPIRDGNVYEDFVEKIDSIIKTYDINKTARDVIEYITTIDNNQYVTYIPNITSSGSLDNFKLTTGSGLTEVRGLYIKIKDYRDITSNVVLKYQWSNGG